MNKPSPLDVAPGRYWAWEHSADQQRCENTSAAPRMRLAILSTHPVQYHSPWFRALARRPEIDLYVYYCHQLSPAEQGAGFEVLFQWDVPLLDGYNHTFLCKAPSTGRSFRRNTADISEIISSSAPDVVLVNGWHYRSAWQAIRACWRENIPVIVRGDSHLFSPRSLLRKLAKDIPFRAVIPRFSGCAAVGIWSRDYFLHYGAQQERLFTIPHSVDVEWLRSTLDGFKQNRASLLAKWQLQPDAATFLFIGKFITQKHPLDFIHAISKARTSGANVQGLMVGDGHLRAICEEAVNTTGAPVRFAGFLNQSQIASACAVATAVVMPSEDTWGVVINEALACGVPCIVSDRVGSGPDLIAQSRAGEVVPLNDVERLANTMAAWARDPQRVTTMASRAWQQASSFTAEVGAMATVSACQAVVQGKQTLLSRRAASR